MRRSPLDFSIGDSIKTLQSALSGEEKVSLYDSPSAILALIDVTLVLSYMYDNYQEIIDCVRLGQANC
jgi:hypothetical protein